jgi:predicted aspartyl protease
MSESIRGHHRRPSSTKELAMLRPRTGTAAARALALVVALALFVALLSGCAVRIGQVQQVSVTGGIKAPVSVHQVNGATEVLINLTIESRGPYTFVLDTGASTSAITTSLARQLGLKRAGPPHEVSGVGGTVQALPVHIANWSAGQIHLPTTVIDSAPLTDLQLGSADGLLGSDVLSQFGTVTIDYTDQSLTIYRQIA